MLMQSFARKGGWPCVGLPTAHVGKVAAQSPHWFSEAVRFVTINLDSGSLASVTAATDMHPVSRSKLVKMSSDSSIKPRLQFRIVTMLAVTASFALSFATYRYGGLALSLILFPLVLLLYFRTQHDDHTPTAKCMDLLVVALVVALMFLLVLPATQMDPPRGFIW
jgi:hypothetical protein